MKVETQKKRQFLSLNFGDVMSKPRINFAVKSSSQPKKRQGYKLNNPFRWFILSFWKQRAYGVNGVDRYVTFVLNTLYQNTFDLSKF